MNTIYDNPGVMSPITASLLIIFSVILIPLDFFKVIDIGYWWAALPALLVFGSSFAHRLIYASVLYALQKDAEAHELSIAINHDIALNDSVTLDADKFLRAVAEDDGLGRA